MAGYADTFGIFYLFEGFFVIKKEAVSKVRFNQFCQVERS